MTCLPDAVCIGAEFFDREPASVARELLGCLLVSERDGLRAGGVIVETEAYLGRDDPGSHAATKGMTERNRVMFGPPGSVYVYFTYGMHHMLNLVCGPEGVAGAVLVRALEPACGVGVLRTRRPGVSDRDLCRGPGRLTRALAVDMADNATMLGSQGLWVYHGEKVDLQHVGMSGRVGLSAGQELDLRYYIDGNRYVSQHRTGVPRPARRAKGGTRSEADRGI